MSGPFVRVAVQVAVLSTCVLSAACTSDRGAGTAPPVTPPPAAREAAAPASPALSQEDQVERHLRAEGYVVRMREGEKLFCKRQENLGSRLMSGLQCATKEALQAREEHDQAEAQAAQARARTGCPKPCN